MQRFAARFAPKRNVGRNLSKFMEMQRPYSREDHSHRHGTGCRSGISETLRNVRGKLLRATLRGYPGGHQNPVGTTGVWNRLGDVAAGVHFAARATPATERVQQLPGRVTCDERFG